MPTPSSAIKSNTIRAMRHRADRLMMALCWMLWLVSFGFAPQYDTWAVCGVCATFLALVATALVITIPGTKGSRIGMALVLMGFAVLTIDQTHGAIEAHFGIFALLAFLLYYRDWRPILTAAAAIAIHHVLFCWLQMRGYPVYVFPPGREHNTVTILVHAAYVSFEAAMLMYLARAVRNEALDSLSIASFAERIDSSGAIDLAFDSTRHRGAAARGLTNLLTAILGVSRHSGTLASRIRQISEDISASSAGMVEITQKKIQRTALITDSVHCMAEAAEQIKTDCASVAQVATQSANIVSEGCATIQQTANLMLTVSETASSTIAEITQLQTESARIESIVEIMNDMANQSALLALNASIEAARAGEKGRGFQVVAQEIRTLSERSYQSLSEVQAIVDSIRHHVDQLQTHADRFQSAASTGRSQVTAAHGALTEVAQHLPLVADRVDRVLHAVDHQATLSAEVVSGMTLIGEAMHTIAGEVRGVSALSQSLEQISEELSANVRQFHYEGQPLRPALA